MNEPQSLDISAILELLPRRFPLLLVDRVLELQPGKSIRALKNVTYNEPFFTGHFPNRPLMPGVMVIEALAQTAGILYSVTAGLVSRAAKHFLFDGLDRARFRKPVGPGDQLLLSAQLERSVETRMHFSTHALVGNIEVASAEIVMIRPAKDQ